MALKRSYKEEYSIVEKGMGVGDEVGENVEFTEKHLQGSKEVEHTVTVQSFRFETMSRKIHVSTLPGQF